MTTPISLQKITKFFHYGPVQKPMRDWLIIIGLALVAFFASIFFNVVTFWNIMEHKSIVKQVTTSVPVINQNAINKVNTIFSTRATEQVKYESGVYSFTDPSQ